MKYNTYINTEPFRHLYPFESRFAPIRDFRMHYLDEGEGPPVVMLHGNPTWSFYFRNLVKGLPPEYRKIVPDHIGCGLSDKPGTDTYDYRLKSRVDDLEALLEHLNIRDNITLVLHDWGGMIGMAYAVRYPERISGIVVTNTAAFLPPSSKSIPLRLKIIRNLPFLATPAVLGLNLFAAAALYMAPSRPLHPDVKKGLIAPYNSWKNRIATLKFVQDIPLEPDDFSYRLVRSVDDNLHCLKKHPLLILWGMKDFVFDRDYFTEWKNRFPGAESHAFRNAGHYLLEDAPDAVLTHIKHFLEAR